MTQTPELGGEVALVTGAASGIGAATAVLLAARGYRVALLDRADTVEVLDLLPTGQVAPFLCDVRDQASIDAAVASTVERWGRLDAVAACAGVESSGDVLALSDEDWHRTMDINAGGVFRTAKAVMPHLARCRGAFVAVASDAGVTGAQGYVAYNASKHAVVGIVRCLALDHGPQGVRSNAVCPGFVDTAMTARIFSEAPPEQREAYERSVPLGRFASPDEVARAIAHLLGPDASYTNGLIYAIDGGTTAGYFEPPGA